MMKRLYGFALAGGIIFSLGCQPPEREVDAYQDLGQDPVDTQQEFEPVEFDDQVAQESEQYDPVFDEIESVDEPAYEPEPQVIQEPADPQPGEQTHTVAAGETLWQIAEDYYGSGVERERIIDANPEIDNEDQIFEGQELIIP